MPIAPQQIGSTASKSATEQFSEKRIAGLPLIIPVAAGVSSVPNTRLVSLQEDVNGNRFAVIGNIALTNVTNTLTSVALTIIGRGALEAALQSGGVNSIAPTPNNYVQGDLVTVVRDVASTFMIDADPSNLPAVGIAGARVDAQGRLTSLAAAGGIIALAGSVFKSVPGLQLSGQLKTNAFFYTMLNALEA